MTADEKKFSTPQGASDKEAPRQPRSKPQPSPETEDRSPLSDAEGGSEATNSDPSRQPS